VKTIGFLMNVLCRKTKKVQLRVQIPPGPLKLSFQREKALEGKTGASSNLLRGKESEADPEGI